MTETAKTLNVLVHVPTDALMSSAKTALEFARLLNEARILLRDIEKGLDIFPVATVAEFEARCREQVGPIGEKVPK